MRFSDLKLIDPILRAVEEEGYTEPTPIQVQAIPHVLEGRDLLGLAQTGTGKTAAFALPLLQRLVASKAAAPAGQARHVRVLIITPTRELASQIGESFRSYGRHLGMKHVVIFGGVNQNPQADALRGGVDIVVATPGRLLDHLQQRNVRFDKLEAFILDEADRMLDMGFIPDVKRIIATLPSARQTLFFSATMPHEAAQLANTLLKNPAKVSVVPPATTVDKVDQRVYLVSKSTKSALMVELLADREWKRVLVFTRTKHGANKLVEHLRTYGSSAEVIHGNKSQGARERALAAFKAGTARVMVATDIAARGIDIDDVTHVVNFDLPNEPESYVHRIGRTARAGAAGFAVSLCDPSEQGFLKDIERTIRRTIRVSPTPPITHTPVARAPVAASEGGRDSRDGQRTGGRGNGRSQGGGRDGQRTQGAQGSGRSQGGAQGGGRSQGGAQGGGRSQGAGGGARSQGTGGGPRSQGTGGQRVSHATSARPAEGGSARPAASMRRLPGETLSGTHTRPKA